MKIKFKVFSRVNNKIIVNEFFTFAAAAGHADALTGTRFLDAEVYTDNGFSHSGALFVYKNGENRKLLNRGFLNQYIHLMIPERIK